MEPLNFKSISNEEIPIQHYAIREHSSERKIDEYISKKKKQNYIYIEKWNLCLCATRQCGYGSTSGVCANKQFRKKYIYVYEITDTHAAQ